MPRRSAADALAQVRAENPQLADHVHLGVMKAQLALFSEQATPNPARRDHDWRFRGLDVPAKGAVSRWQCSICEHWLERAGRDGNLTPSYFSPDGRVKLERRPACAPATSILADVDDVKRAYVAREEADGSDGTHLCHAPNCTTPIPPGFAMCRPHWRMVPPAIRRRIWRHFRPGQERDKKPSRAYVAALRDAIDALKPATGPEGLS